MLSYGDLRTAFPEFIYHGYQVTESQQDIHVQYHFEIKGLSEFTPSWVFPKKVGDTAVYKDNTALLNMVFSLGMVELISYWKITCSPKVSILCGSLDETQVAWWKKLYFNGLGEFYYTNHIDVSEDDFMTIEVPVCKAAWVSDTEGAKIPVFDMDKTGRRKDAKELKGCLIPVGGGKDSAVTLDILKSSKADNYCYIINPRGATLNTVDAAGYSRETQLVAVKRTLDARMIELNRQGYLNGHTPYSAIVAFSSTIAAYLYGLKYIVLSNESSANESTVEGSSVNHQYSKSFEFENDFHSYEAAYIQSGTYYFSLLRPLSEFQIAAHFSLCPEYHDIFRSCNAGSKQDIWCGHCPKCLFVYLILSPFLPAERMKEIFGTDMLSDPEMKTYFSQLIGIGKEKPFECVGSRDEINTAICMTIDDLKSEGKALPYLFEYYMTTELYEQHHQAECPYDNFYDKTNLLPEAFAKLLKDACFGENAKGARKFREVR